MQKREADITEPIYHYPAILSGDYYMFDYESDEEEDEGKQDEATVAQEQVN